MSETYSPAGNVSAQTYKRATVAEAATGTFGDEFMRQDMTQIADRIRFLSDLGYLTFPAAFAGQADPNTLDDYEEGTWTPTDGSGAALSFTNTSGNCRYTKIGRLVVCCFRISFPVTANGSVALIGGLPFTSAATTAAVFGGSLSFTDAALTLMPLINTAAATFVFVNNAGTSPLNSAFSSKEVRGVLIYET